MPSRVPRFELPNSVVTPGFVDGHTHFLQWALGRSRVRLAGAATRADAVRRVAEGVPEQEWIIGQGWDANGWTEAPERQALDAVQSGPVYLDSLDVHSAWLNTAALAKAGIDRLTQDPYGGVIVRDPSGEPTGLLLERAVELATPHLPIPPADRMLAAVREAQQEAHRLGVTGIHDVEGPEALATFRQLESEGHLRLRVLFHPPVARLPDLITHRVQSGMGTEWLSLGGIKLFLDGSLGSRTAWMLEAYEDGRDCGMPITTESEARAAVALAAGAGIAATIHAIGDAAVRRALDLLSSVPKVGIPHRIEHFQCVHPADLDRAAAQGIVVSMQPAHLLTDIPLADERWGARARGAYAFRSLAERGTVMVFGSDVPVASMDPREGVFAALERSGGEGGPSGGWYPDEKIGFEEVVRAYSYAAAFAAGVGGRRGTLAPGMDADLVAWEVDPAIDCNVGAAFRSSRAVLTVVGGEVVMRA